MQPRPYRSRLTLTFSALGLLALASPASAADGAIDAGSKTSYDDGRGPVCDRPSRRPRPAPTPHHPHRAVREDLSSSWLHVGGGFGSVLADPSFSQTVPAGRFVAGGGGYTLGFYGGGEIEVDSTRFEPLSVTAVGFAGFAVPVPVFHPMVGIRAGGGHHLVHGDFSPHLTIGPQVGVIIRQFDGRPGLRVMVDLGLEYGLEEQAFSPDLFVTFAATF